MYKLLLTLRYLRRKLTPIFALLAVMLCTAMVIIVSSVMGGFLDLVRNAGRALMGDVSMDTGLGGFAHYDELIQQIEQLDEAAAATPLIKAYGLLKLPGNRVKAVQVHGIRGEGQDRVTGYRNTLHWTQQRLDENPGLGYGGKDPVDAAMKLKAPWPGAENIAAIVPGLEISPYNHRAKDGTYEYYPSILGMRLVLNVLPITQAGGMETLSTDVRQVLVVNEFHSGLYDVDANRVFVAFDVAQEMMLMDEAEKIAKDSDGDLILNEDGKIKIVGTVPGRCTEIQIRTADGYTPDQLRNAVADLYRQFRKRYPKELPLEFDMRIQTWEQSQAQYIATIEHEKGLLTVLFGVISIVAIVMIAVIFYMIVLEKTRDIGVLRSLGASPAGVTSIFLGYGGSIGLVGAGLGTGLAYIVVRYINAIHAWLGDGLGVAVFIVGAIVGGIFLVGVPGLIQYALGATFGISRMGQVLWMLLIGPVLNTTVFVAVLLAARVVAGRFPLDGTALAWTLPAIVVGGLLLYLIDAGLYLLLERVIQRRRLWIAAVMAAIGALPLLVGAIVALMRVQVRGQDLSSYLNDHLAIVIWDRSVYFFDSIPNRLDWMEALAIVILAVLASIVGAVVPAILAARVNPVESLRYE